jgi:hypothetical protein
LIARDIAPTNTIVADSAGSSSGPVDLSTLLRNRHWLLRTSPFAHAVVHDVFSDSLYSDLKRELGRLVLRGLGSAHETDRLARNMPNSDAHAWNFPPDVDGSFGLFYSRAWRDMLAGLFGIAPTEDVNAAVHYHQVGSANGSVHRDLGVAWFSDQPRADGINPMDLTRCSYTSGKTSAPDIAAREVVRAITMIYYIGNPAWTQGDGGETGLYRAADDDVAAPALAVAPIENSILVFENTPASYHGFIRNHQHPRTSIILWLHRRKTEALARFGDAVRLTW